MTYSRESARLHPLASALLVLAACAVLTGCRSGPETPSTPDGGDAGSDLACTDWSSVAEGLGDGGTRRLPLQGPVRRFLTAEDGDTLVYETLDGRLFVRALLSGREREVVRAGEASLVGHKVSGGRFPLRVEVEPTEEWVRTEYALELIDVTQCTRTFSVQAGRVGPTPTATSLASDRDFSGMLLAQEWSSLTGSRVEVLDIATDGGTRLTTGLPGAVASSSPRLSSGSVYAESRRSQLAAPPDGVAWWDFAADAGGVLSRPDFHVTDLALSGQRLVFSEQPRGTSDGGTELWLVELADGSPRKLTDAPGTRGAPSVHAGWVAWEERGPGGTDIYLLDVTGNGGARAIAATPQEETEPHLTPHGLIYREDAGLVWVPTLAP